MVEKLNIVQSATEPDKRNIWFKGGELKKFGAKGWSTIGGSNGGGGTSTDKDALDIYIDIDTNSIIVNGKTYAASGQNSDINLHAYSKELYNMLYNSLINTYKTVYIKTIPTNPIYVFCEPSITITPSEGIITLVAYIGAGILSIAILNQ